ncbi:hypothetical protein AE621_28705 [Acidovorax sp. SD340]|nr:hypothetical protein AE621_28705 [Acidovorax sp. SD340]
MAFDVGAGQRLAIGAHHASIAELAGDLVGYVLLAGIKVFCLLMSDDFSGAGLRLSFPVAGIGSGTVMGPRPCWCCCGLVLRCDLSRIYRAEAISGLPSRGGDVAV